MQIIEMPIGDIYPCPNNPRSNEKAIEMLKESITDFGFKNPIIVDKNNVIIAGHTRHKAAQELGLQTVPCIMADDLTPEQVRAFRIVDNRTAEIAEWDISLLELELEALEIEDLDLSSYNFDFNFEADIEPSNEPSNQPTERAYYGDERERTADAYNLWEFNDEQCAGKYQIPIVHATQHVPTGLIGFNYMLTSEEYDKGIHFFLDDYQFERLWNTPYKYFDRLKQFDCVVMPDYSMYVNMPEAMKIWNCYRNHLMAQMMQNYGIEVIPCPLWANESSCEYCFDGIEPYSVVCITTIGVKRDKEATRIWNAGMTEVMERLKPTKILLYGGEMDFDFGSVPVMKFKNEVTERWKRRTKDGR